MGSQPIVNPDQARALCDVRKDALAKAPRPKIELISEEEVPVDLEAQLARFVPTGFRKKLVRALEDAKVGQSR